MAVVAIAIGAYLLVPPLCAGALFDGVVEVEPPAPAGAGLLDDGLVAGVLAGVGLFGMLDPTPVVCDFGMRACAIRVCCCLPSRAVRVIRCCLLTCAVRICGMLDPEAAVCVPSMRLTRASCVLRSLILLDLRLLLHLRRLLVLRARSWRALHAAVGRRRRVLGSPLCLGSGGQAEPQGKRDQSTCCMLHTGILRWIAGT